MISLCNILSVSQLFRGKEQFGYIKHSLNNSTSLLVAVILSLVLAGIFGLLGIVIFIVALNQAFNFFSGESKHVKKYVQRHEADLPAEQIDTYALVSFNNIKLKDNLSFIKNQWLQCILER
jgi:hypothetical protein